MGQYDAQEASIRRQQMIAKALRDSGNQGFDPAATAGKLVYARSPWEDLSRIAQQGLAGRLDYLAEKKATDLQDQRQADAKTRLAGMVDTLAGKSAPVLDQPDDPALSPISGLSTIRNPVTGKDEPLSLGTETNAKRASLAAILKGEHGAVGCSQSDTGIHDQCRSCIDRDQVASGKRIGKEIDIAGCQCAGRAGEVARCPPTR